MHPALARTAHRPWPLPARPWIGRQSWCDILFAHWPVPAALLRPLVPQELEVQERDGTSWVGVTPFRMEGVSARYVPDLPLVSAFPELNVRVYVERDGQPGVWFLSLDATSRLAVRAARLFFHLPYFRADILIARTGSGFEYRLERRGPPAARFAATYAPHSGAFEAAPGTIDYWLTERYCLYSQSAGALYRAEVHHAPWPLQQAAAEIRVNSMGAPHGLSLAGPPALLHFARRVDTVVWTPERVA